ncbi:MAG: beta-N-acetylhexosaminidase [Janthinobacterium lividum]
MIPAIVGIAGRALDGAEAALLRVCPPAGVILFGRNVESPAQLRALADSLRAVLPEGAVLAVDQEGGRVARLRPPHWRAHPPAGAIGALPAGMAERAAWLTGALIGLDCAAAGLDLACAPVLDRRVPGAHDVIGDRAFSADPSRVAALGRAMAQGLLAAGVQPVGKHAPGHGRAGADSHLALPELDDVCDEDLVPFAVNADMAWMMTAHVRYAALDRLPATLSAAVVGGVLRGRLGLRGVLVTDDLAMGAVASGGVGPGALACAALAAGCDVALHCSGLLADTEAVLRACPPMTEGARGRMAAARALAEGARQALDAGALDEERRGLLAGVA